MFVYYVTCELGIGFSEMAGKTVSGRIPIAGVRSRDNSVGGIGRTRRSPNVGRGTQNLRRVQRVLDEAQ